MWDRVGHTDPRPDPAIRSRSHLEAGWIWRAAHSPGVGSTRKVTEDRVGDPVVQKLSSVPNIRPNPQHKGPLEQSIVGKS